MLGSSSLRRRTVEKTSENCRITLYPPSSILVLEVRKSYILMGTETSLSFAVRTSIGYEQGVCFGVIERSANGSLCAAMQNSKGILVDGEQNNSLESKPW